MSIVTLINPFEVPQGTDIEELLQMWEKVAEYLRQQPGFISTRLHRAITPQARFRLINVAEWESAEHFQIAISSEEFKTLSAELMTTFPSYPGLYEVVRT